MTGFDPVKVDSEFLYVELNFRVILERVPYADEAAAVFFDDIDQVKAFCNQFVTQAGAA